MSDRDISLINKANQLSSIDWGIAYNMIDQAQSTEAKSKLKEISKRLYHIDEGRYI